MSPQDTDIKPADSQAGPLLRRLPPHLQAYAQLARYDRPIGTWLLFWPCVWGMAMAAGEIDSLPPWTFILAFAIGSIAMRGAGCTYNDIADRHLDAQVSRTAGRPMPSGRVTTLGAWGFLGAQLFIGLLVLLSFQSVFMFWLGAIALIPVAIYPYMKRLTYWPQAWLGMTFNWGALMGYASIAGALPAQAFALYAAGFFWTLGYDTIYAHQDKEDDALIGVKSTALLFGPKTKPALFVFYTLSLSALAYAAYLSQIGILFWAAFAIIIWQMMMQIMRLDIDNADICLQIFRSNRNTGLMIAGSFILGIY